MHPNPVYHTATEADNIAYARDRAFGVLAVAAPDAAPMLSHVPFLLSEDGSMAEMHLVRSNPIARALQRDPKSPLPTRIAVSGPDSYVSPDWYGMEDQVPTWNYVAVHLTGMLEAQPEGTLADLLDRQSAFFEDRLTPKVPWTMEKVSDEAKTRLMRMIMPCRLRITGVDGTWKLSQNKPDEVRIRAATHVSAQGFGAETQILAALMHGAGG